MQRRAEITCWDVLAGRPCPRGLGRCTYCQADAAAKPANHSAHQGLPISSTAGKSKLVTLHDFSDELKDLEEAELRARLRMELEAFGELCAFALQVNNNQKKIAVASYENALCAEHAVEALANPNFDIPFKIVLGVLSSAPPPKPFAPFAPVVAQTRKWIIFIDELQMPKRPSVQPVSSDCEVFIKTLPPQEKIALQEFGEVVESFRLPNAPAGRISCKGYIRFSTHEAAKKCVESGLALWSESERALAWQRVTKGFKISAHTYPYSIVSTLIGEKGADINKLRMACGLSQLWVEGVDEKSQWHRLHFVVVGSISAVANAQQFLEKKMADIHEDMSQNLLSRGLDAAPVLQNGMSIWSTIVHIDELHMARRPSVEVATKDREVWVQQVPCSPQEVEDWKSTFGEIEDAFALPCIAGAEGAKKGYVLFLSHESAKACVEAGIGTWSESERALSWQGFSRHSKKSAHTYPMSIVSWFLQNSAEFIKDIAKRCGILTLKMCGGTVGESPISKRLHFVAEGGSNACMKTLITELESKLEEVHRDIQKLVYRRKRSKRWFEVKKRNRREWEARAVNGIDDRSVSDDDEDDIEDGHTGPMASNPYLHGHSNEFDVALEKEAKRMRPSSSKPVPPWRR